MIHLFKAEFLKFKANRLLHGILFVCMGNVLLQSYFAWKESGIPSTAVWITGLDLFVSVVLPIMIPIFVTFSCYVDQENHGIKLFTLKGISGKKLFYSKWIFCIWIMNFYFFLGFFITIPFMLFRGVGIFKVILIAAPYILSSSAVIVLLINISFLLNVISKSYLIPPVIGLIGVIMGSFNVGKWLSQWNPFSYLSRLLFLKAMSRADLLIILSMVLLSFYLLKISEKLYVRNLDYEE
ncbi:ABC transporter permease [Blautia sp. XA-2221]|uniref:ABC transporter permease n=1 Tax=Blautia sp. XA-2221 TaxID=2903961 RepID=UPI002378A3D7|nr:ABC transporter permease [Blautia sp. XA-2221]